MPQTSNKFFSSRWAILLFIAICFSVSSFGAVFTPGEWYQQLNRAPWSPPNMAFPIVWSLLYLMIAVAGWLVFRYGDAHLKTLWVIQLFVNGIWSWLFFGQHWVFVGLVDLVILVTLVALLIQGARKKKLANVAWLLSPYFVWLLLATSLNAYILLFN